MWRKYWLWGLALLLSCNPAPPPLPIPEQKLLPLVRHLYAYRASLQAQNTPPPVTDSLMQLYTAQVLRESSVSPAEWDSLKNYLVRYPDAWKKLLEQALQAPPSP